MHLAPFISIALASTSALVSASAIIPRSLSVDEMLAYIDGEVKIVNKNAYFAENGAHAAPSSNLTYTPPSQQQPLNGTLARVSRRFGAPPCQKQDIVFSTLDERFLGDDIIMSTVVQAGETDATVAITDGYEIGNTIETSSGASLSFFSDMLGLSYGVEKGRTWTSVYSNAYTFTIPKGHYGVVVSNVWTNRHQGYRAIGCIGEAQDKSTYKSDSYETGSYNKLNWPKGTISLCISKDYPIKKCRGTGNLE